MLAAVEGETRLVSESLEMEVIFLKCGFFGGERTSFNTSIVISVVAPPR